MVRSSINMLRKGGKNSNTLTNTKSKLEKILALSLLPAQTAK